MFHPLTFWLRGAVLSYRNLILFEYHVRSMRTFY